MFFENCITEIKISLYLCSVNYLNDERRKEGEAWGQT